MPQRISNTMCLRDAETRTHATMRARVIKALGGRARALYELATGVAAVDEDGPGTPLNPQGLLGVDLSGPPWGSAPRHCIAWRGGILSTAGWAGQRHVGSLQATGAVLTADDPVVTIPWHVWVRPHEQGVRVPYSRGYARVSLALDSIGATDVSLTCSADAEVPGRSSPSSTLTVSTTTEVDYPTDSYWALVPGWNRLLLRLEHDGAGPDVHVLAAYVDQRVKRSHPIPPPPS